MVHFRRLLDRDPLQVTEGHLIADNKSEFISLLNEIVKEQRESARAQQQDPEEDENGKEDFSSSENTPSEVKFRVETVVTEPCSSDRQTSDRQPDRQTPDRLSDCETDRQQTDSSDLVTQTRRMASIPRITRSMSPNIHYDRQSSDRLHFERQNSERQYSERQIEDEIRELWNPRVSYNNLKTTE